MRKISLQGMDGEGTYYDDALGIKTVTSLCIIEWTSKRVMIMESDASMDSHVHSLVYSALASMGSYPLCFTGLPFCF